MPESRNRHKHPHQVQTHHAPAKYKLSVAVVLAVFTAILGLAIAFFTVGTDVVWLIIGAVSGGLIGYFAGLTIDRSLERNREDRR